MRGNLPGDCGKELSIAVHRFFNRLTTPLYAVIDTARDREAFSLLEEADCEYVRVYPPGFSLAMDHRGPHLIPVRPDSRFFNRLIDAGWGNSWGIFLSGPGDVAAVRRHLRRLLFVQLHGGERALFRFYDPRVLRTFLPSCSEDALRQFFGPISTIYLESHSGREVVCFSLESSSEAGPHGSQHLSEYVAQII